MVGATAVLPTLKHRVDKEVTSGGNPTSTTSEYDSPKTPGGMTAQRMQCFKTKRCRFWLESRCTRGERCTYAHTDVELRIPPDLTKTKICTRWKRGACDKDAGECAYAHGIEDLREAVTPSTTTNTGRTHVGTETLSFGVPPPTTKLRDSPPYSSRSCQTISSTASTRYTSRRIDDSDDASSTNEGTNGISNTTADTTNQQQRSTFSTNPPKLESSPAYSQISQPSIAGSPSNRSVDRHSPLLVDRSAMSPALSSAADLGERTPEPDTTMAGASSRLFAQFYTPNTPLFNHAAPISSRWEAPLHRSDRWTHDELLLAVLTDPYYD